MQRKSLPLSVELSTLLVRKVLCSFPEMPLNLFVLSRMMSSSTKTEGMLIKLLEFELKTFKACDWSEFEIQALYWSI